MKKKKVETKVITIMMAASMAASICPVSAWAVTEDKVAKDGTYVSSAKTVKSNDDWADYDVTVSLTVQDGKISDIAVTPGDTYDSQNNSYYNKALNGKLGNFSGITSLIGQDATETTVNSFKADAVSGATIVAEAMKEGALEAIRSADEASTEPTVDTSALETAITNAEKLKEADYTAETWNALKTALESAKTALSEKKSQDAVNGAASTLNTAIQGLQKAETEKEEGYVLMNIPYADFYAADGVESVDSVSSATLNKTRNSGLAAGSYHVDPNGTDITGITFPVKISDMDALKNYTQITDENSVSITVTTKGKETTTEYNGKEALFESDSYSYYVLSAEPSYYKEATVNADGTFTFGEIKGDYKKTELSNVKSEFTTETNYGDYQLNFENLPDINTVYGVVISTAEGGNYGLRQVENIWRKSQLAWSTGFVTTTHGCSLSYEPYKAMMGQTINKVTYYTDAGIYEIPMDQKVPVKFDGELSVADISIDGEAIQSSVTVTNLPTDFEETYELTSSDGSVIDANDYNVNVETDAKGNVTRTLVFNKTPQKGRYTFTLKDKSGTYADVSTTFNMYTEAIPAQYNGNSESPALEKSEAASEDEFATYTKGIQSVTVNGKSYSASGKGKVVLIKEDGSLDLMTDAFKDAKAGDAFTVTVVEDGYKDYTFTYKVPDTESEYTYVYAGLSWSEYWASEGVLAAGSTESSEELDSRGESDKGAFDVVTRATTNHGLHRGSFQCTAIIETNDGTAYNLSYWKDKNTFVTTDGQEVVFADIKANIKDYKVTGLKYVPVKVKTSDYEAFKEQYAVVEKDGTLVGGYGEVNLVAYTATADVTENTNGLKTAEKNEDGTFSFSARTNGTYSGLKDSQLKTATDLEPTVKEGDGSFGEFLRVDFNGDYGDLGSNMQAVKWTYYGDDSTYTEAKASYGTKFASDNWMHKSMGIQLGLTDSIRCKLPEGTDGTGYWSLTIYALGYNDYTYTFQVSEDNIAQPKAADQKDIDALQAKVDEAKALNEVNYTADSWSSMKTELDESEELLKKDSLLSAEVKTQLQHMTDALERLVQKEADLTNLTEAIQKAEAANYNEADYTADSWKVYADALAAAKALTTSEDVLLQSDVNTATENLNAAINALVKAETPSDPDQEVVSTTALEKAITTASELKESDYTADSWKAFQTVFTNAKAAMEAKESQEAVDAATENLNAAINALVKAETPSDPDQEVVSTTALEKAIAAVGELKESDYTADSWKALQNALDAAKAVLSEKKDQATVDAATENLNKAISALVKSSSTEEKKTSTTTTDDKKTSGTGTSATSGSVKTGDPASVFGWLTLAVSSIGAGGFALKRRKRRDDVE